MDAMNVEAMKPSLDAAMSSHGSNIGLDVRIEYDDGDETYPVIGATSCDGDLVISCGDGCAYTCQGILDAIDSGIASGELDENSPVLLESPDGALHDVPDRDGFDNGQYGIPVLPVIDGWEAGRSFNYAYEDVSVLEEDVLYAINKFLTEPSRAHYPTIGLDAPKGWEYGNLLEFGHVARQRRLVGISDDDEIVMLDYVSFITICHSGVYGRENKLISAKTAHFPWGSHPEIAYVPANGFVYIDGFQISTGLFGSEFPAWIANMLKFLFDRCV